MRMQERADARFRHEGTKGRVESAALQCAGQEESSATRQQAEKAARTVQKAADRECLDTMRRDALFIMYLSVCGARCALGAGVVKTAALPVVPANEPETSPAVRSVTPRSRCSRKQGQQETEVEPQRVPSGIERGRAGEWSGRMEPDLCYARRTSVCSSGAARARRAQLCEEASARRLPLAVKGDGPRRRQRHVDEQRRRHRKGRVRHRPRKVDEEGLALA
eukprot:6177544-Pleurochrysis_carterae.AAC.6